MAEISSNKIPEKNTKKHNQAQQLMELFNFLKKLFKILFKFFITLCVLATLILIIGGCYLFIQFNKFSKAAQVPRNEIINIFSKAYFTYPQTTNQFKNILILGIDSLETRGDVPPLADTFMLASINVSNGEIKLLSLPRDIWSEDYKTKINALIAYGEERYPEQPEKFPQEVISDLTGLKIHHSIVLSMDNLATLIDLLGGVEIDIKDSFIDNKFPRSDVDVTVVTDPALLYETVEFKKGRELMNGARALQYIRSRHSQDLETGTDLSRGKRQQQVIQAIITKLKDWKQFAKNPEKAGKLYGYYLHNFSDYLSISELISTGHILSPHLNQIKFKGESLTIYPENKNGVIYHPPLWKYQNQWVYEIRDIDKFQSEIKEKIN